MALIDDTVDEAKYQRLVQLSKVGAIFGIFTVIF